MAPPPTSSSFLRPPPLPHHPHPRLHFRPPSASFRVSEILGGRGLCNGEVGVRKELSSGSSASTTTTTSPAPSSSPSTESPPPPVDLDAFEKEMMGLTGGFPGGEVGLKDFVTKNPPPPKSKKSDSQLAPQATSTLSAPPRTPELPLFLPGMVVLVKNPNNAYYMYCGIVQRVSDGKVAVLFEGGIWDRLITFNLDELEGREKGPPMVNPKSVVLEDLVAQLDEEDEEDEAAKKEKEPEAAAAPA